MTHFILSCYKSISPSSNIVHVYHTTNKRNRPPRGIHIKGGRPDTAAVFAVRGTTTWRDKRDQRRLGASSKSAVTRLRYAASADYKNIQGTHFTRVSGQSSSVVCRLVSVLREFGGRLLTFSGAG